MKNYLEEAQVRYDNSILTGDTVTLAPLFAQQAQAAALLDIAEALGCIAGVLIEWFEAEHPPGRKKPTTLPR